VGGLTTGGLVGGETGVVGGGGVWMGGFGCGEAWMGGGLAAVGGAWMTGLAVGSGGAWMMADSSPASESSVVWVGWEDWWHCSLPEQPRPRRRETKPR
jgi:hypothetical protein